MELLERSTQDSRQYHFNRYSPLDMVDVKKKQGTVSLAQELRETSSHLAQRIAILDKTATQGIDKAKMLW